MPGRRCTRLVPTPSAVLDAAATALAGATVEAAHAWPVDLPRDPALDVRTVDRSLAAATARFGPLALGTPIAGDGVTTATWELWPIDAAAGAASDARVRGGRAPARLVLAVTPEGAVRSADLLVAPLEAPYEAW